MTVASNKQTSEDQAGHNRLLVNITVQSVQQIRRRPEWNPENETAKATQLVGASTPVNTDDSRQHAIEGVALCWHPDPVPAPTAIDTWVLFTLPAIATALVYTNRSLAALLLLLLCLPTAANFYMYIAGVVIVAQLLCLKCMHVLVETSIYVACYSHRGISTYVLLYIQYFKGLITEPFYSMVDCRSQTINTHS